MDNQETIKWTGLKFNTTDFREKKPILTFLRGDQVGRHILLAEDTITLGRAPDATILINDNHVSRVHCNIEYDKQFNVYLLNDLNSSNGTLLNDERVSRAILEEGDKIIMGGTVLKYSLVDKIDIEFHGELEKLINIDELTGLVVKRRFDEELHRHVAVAHRDESKLSMLMMDLDGIKTINDTRGHPFGAYTIAETGKLVKKIISGRGLSSRFGGDEFMSFLPGATLEEAVAAAESVRAEVESHSYEKEGIRLRPTISIGAAELGKDESAEDLLKRADEALYRAKNAGKNRVST